MVGQFLYSHGCKNKKNPECCGCHFSNPLASQCIWSFWIFDQCSCITERCRISQLIFSKLGVFERDVIRLTNNQLSYTFEINI